MDIALRNARQDLVEQGATALPTETAVTEARDGSSWSGPAAEGRTWKLTKNARESYYVQY